MEDGLHAPVGGGDDDNYAVRSSWYVCVQHEAWAASDQILLGKFFASRDKGESLPPIVSASQISE